MTPRSFRLTTFRQMTSRGQFLSPNVVSTGYRMREHLT